MNIETIHHLFSTLLPWHPARVSTFIHCIIGIVSAGYVQQIKVAIGFPAHTQSASVCQRIRRFLKEQSFDDEIIAPIIMKLFWALNLPVELTLDRTNWKYGKRHINFLVLAIAIGPGMSIPLLLRELSHPGNSCATERTDLIGRFLTLFPHIPIRSLIADREFIGQPWIRYLSENNIPYYIRIKENRVVPYGQQTLQVRDFFTHLKVGGFRCVETCIYQQKVYLAGTRSSQGDLVIVMSNQDKRKGILDVYRGRWSIEVMFRSAKTNGFNLEKTALVHPQRLEKLLMMVSVALGLCYMFGKKEEVRKKTPYKRTVKAPLFCTFRRGFDAIRRCLVNASITVMEFIKYLLSCALHQPQMKSVG
jgi:hypothetical protein